MGSFLVRSAVRSAPSLPISKTGPSFQTRASPRSLQSTQQPEPSDPPKDTHLHILPLLQPTPTTHQGIPTTQSWPQSLQTKPQFALQLLAASAPNFDAKRISHTSHQHLIVHQARGYNTDRISDIPKPSGDRKFAQQNINRNVDKPRAIPEAPAVSMSPMSTASVQALYDLDDAEYACLIIDTTDVVSTHPLFSDQLQPDSREWSIICDNTSGWLRSKSEFNRRFRRDSIPDACHAEAMQRILGDAKRKAMLDRQTQEGISRRRRNMLKGFTGPTNILDMPTANTKASRLRIHRRDPIRDLRHHSLILRFISGQIMRVNLTKFMSPDRLRFSAYPITPAELEWGKFDNWIRYLTRHPHPSPQTDQHVWLSATAEDPVTDSDTFRACLTDHMNGIRSMDDILLIQKDVKSQDNRRTDRTADPGLMTSTDQGLYTVCHTIDHSTDESSDHRYRSEAPKRPTLGIDSQHETDVEEHMRQAGTT